MRRINWVEKERKSILLKRYETLRSQYENIRRSEIKLYRKLLLYVHIAIKTERRLDFDEIDYNNNKKKKIIECD